MTAFSEICASSVCLLCLRIARYRRGNAGVSVGAISGIFRRPGCSRQELSVLAEAAGRTRLIVWKAAAVTHFIGARAGPCIHQQRGGSTTCGEDKHHADELRAS